MKVRIKILVTVGTILFATVIKATQMAADYLKSPEGRAALHTFLKHASSFLSVESNRKTLKESAKDTIKDAYEYMGSGHYIKDGWEIEE